MTGPSAGSPDLWTVPAAQCNLADGAVYHYWFEVTDSHPQRPGKRIRITDPMAFAVDWRLVAAHPEGPGYNDDDQYPAAVVMFKQGKLLGCDIGGEGEGWLDEPPLAALPPNNRLVIYELPTAWTRTGSGGERERGLGTFRDVAALVDPDEGGENFSDLEVVAKGRSYLTELGVNAVELCPPADSFYVRQWGYGTTNFFAPDFELGFPVNYSWPRCNCSLRTLVNACHRYGVRFFADVVMAFAKFPGQATAEAADQRFLVVGKRVLAWRRGRTGSDSIVVVVANFSDFGTADPGNGAAEYRVHNWPATPSGKMWREVTRERNVPNEWIGREPIFPWEAKVYTTV